MYLHCCPSQVCLDLNIRCCLPGSLQTQDKHGTQHVSANSALTDALTSIALLQGSCAKERHMLCQHCNHAGVPAMQLCRIAAVSPLHTEADKR